LFLYRASIGNNFISENGIVAVLGYKNQVVTEDITRTNNPLLFERGISAKSGTFSPPAGRWFFQGASTSTFDRFSEVSS